MSEKEIVWNWIAIFLSVQTRLYPDPLGILNAYPVGTPLTPSSEFVIITRLGIDTNYLPQVVFNIPNQALNMENMIASNYQLDFYGVNAQTAANAWQTYITSSKATDDLQSVGYGVGRVDNVVQLTNDIDRDVYVGRFISRFSLLNIATLAIAQNGITLPDVVVTFPERIN